MKVVVCIVSDGRQKIHPRTLACIQKLGCYQPGPAKNVCPSSFLLLFLLLICFSLLVSPIHWILTSADPPAVSARDQSVNGKAVTAHIYEYTTQMRVDSKLNIVPGKADSVPVQLLLSDLPFSPPSLVSKGELEGLKRLGREQLLEREEPEEAQLAQMVLQRLSLFPSLRLDLPRPHPLADLWPRPILQAFGPLLVPNVCVLIDAGTAPGPTSIYHLWKSFDVNSDVGGACGEIVALKGKYWSSLFKNPLVAAQNFEWVSSPLALTAR